MFSPRAPLTATKRRTPAATLTARPWPPGRTKPRALPKSTALPPPRPPPRHPRPRHHLTRDPPLPQPKRRAERPRLSHPWTTPAPRPNRPAKTGLHRPSCSPERETSSVLLPGARRAPSCSSGRETSDGPQPGEGQPLDRSIARTTRRWSDGRSGPTANEPTPEIAGRHRGQIRQTTV